MKRRMSLERLALCHVALSGPGPEARAAQELVLISDLDDVHIGHTFAETLELSRPDLDLYEEKAHVGLVYRYEVLPFLPGAGDPERQPAFFGGGCS